MLEERKDGERKDSRKKVTGDKIVSRDRFVEINQTICDDLQKKKRRKKSPIPLARNTRRRDAGSDREKKGERIDTKKGMKTIKENYIKRKKIRTGLIINFRDPPVSKPSLQRVDWEVNALLAAFPPFFLLSLPVRHAHAIILPCSSCLSRNEAHLRRCTKLPHSLRGRRFRKGWARQSVGNRFCEDISRAGRRYVRLVDGERRSV